MNRSWNFLAVFLVAWGTLGSGVRAGESGSRAPENLSERVIVLVLDGVRWQDFFDVRGSRLRPDDGSPPPFQGYWKRIFPGGVAFGDRSRGSAARMTLSGPFSRRSSLPSYQAMLAGFAQPCPGNDCERIAVETLPEAIARRLKLPPEKVAVIASWPGLVRAAAQKPDTIHVDAGDRRQSGGQDGVAVTREDAKTAEIALDHLRRHAPRFLFVVFDAADHAAHEGDLAAYIAELRRLDAIILRFFQTLEEMGPGELARTTLLVTTDHGRGSWGPLWQYHAVVPFATEVFVAASGPRTLDKGRVSEHPRSIQLADLRPTIEILLGLEPTPCEHETCGQPIPEVIGVDAARAP